MPEEQSAGTLQGEVHELRSALSSLTRAFMPPAKVVRRRTSNSTTVNQAASSPPFTILPPDEQEILAGGTASEGPTAVDLSSTLPTGTRYAYLRFSGNASEDGRSLLMRHRPASDSGWATALHLIPIEEAADTASNDNSEWIVLAGDVSFEYEVVCDAPAAWSLTLLGYA